MNTISVNNDCAVCWFQVFDVVLNGEHTIVSELDIFGRVGRGVAHDEVVPFSIKGGKLRVSGEQSQIDGKKISLEFVKVSFLFSTFGVTFMVVLLIVLCAWHLLLSCTTLSMEVALCLVLIVATSIPC